MRSKPLFAAAAGSLALVLAAGCTDLASRDARATVPVTGSYKQDDIVWKTGVVEAGTVGSKYVHIGWVCVASGTPGTWKEMRVLTGG